MITLTDRKTHEPRKTACIFHHLWRCGWLLVCPIGGRSRPDNCEQTRRACLHNQDRSLPRSAGDSRRCRSNRASPVRHGIDNDDQERRQAEGGKAICLLALYPISDSSLCVARHTTTKKVRKAKMLAMLPKQAQWAVAGALAVFIVAGAGSLAALVLNRLLKYWFAHR